VVLAEILYTTFVWQAEFAASVLTGRIKVIPKRYLPFWLLNTTRYVFSRKYIQLVVDSGTPTSSY